MIEVYSELGLLLLSYATLWFIVSLVIKRNDVADIAWGLAYFGICVYCYWRFTPHLVSTVVYVLVSLWGLRLSIYIAIRNAKKSEDFRYKKWREEWGTTFYWRSFLQVYVLQTLLLLIISSPVILAASSSPEALHWSSVLGVIVWLFGFYWQALGDYQLSQFRKKRSKGDIMKTGLWKYSRHPNYFGEVVMWWAIFLVVLPLEYGMYSIVSPLLINWLIVKVSGIPMLEAKYKNNEAYQIYKCQTPALIPKLTGR